MFKKIVIFALLICISFQACSSAVSYNTLSSTQKLQILAKHNELRQQVASGKQSPQPSATNMRELIWDEELATLAQNYANTCPDGHNSQLSTKSYSSVGENLYWRMSTVSSSNVNLTLGVQAWYDEVKDYSANDVAKVNFQSNTGHYTQVVWALTDKVGCGTAQYYKSTDKYYYTVLVCNYHVAGNLLGSPVYLQGTAASACTSVSACYNALCKTTGSSSTCTTSWATATNTTTSPSTGSTTTTTGATNTTAGATNTSNLSASQYGASTTKTCKNGAYYMDGSCFMKYNSLAKCQPCTDDKQCASPMYCCPYMRKCIESSSTSCSYPIAGCYSNQKTCDNSNFPTKWLTCDNTTKCDDGTSSSSSDAPILSLGLNIIFVVLAILSVFRF